MSCFNDIFKTEIAEKNLDNNLNKKQLIHLLFERNLFLKKAVIKRTLITKNDITVNKYKT